VEWCGQSRPATRWRSRSFGLVLLSQSLPLRESGTRVRWSLAVLALQEPVSSQQWVAVGLAIIEVMLVQVG
jgi:uncharacterized membrane protein